ncbi:MAG: hypothetical protein JST12_17130 [Armatimonadetes bacterium]|nr:hypothetical protein [Armatimonadota bacterium]
MSLLLDWFFGAGKYRPEPVFQRMDEDSRNPTQSPHAAPILKLNRAILLQAMADQASRIDLWTGIPELELHRVETLQEYEDRIRKGDGAEGSMAEFRKELQSAGIATENSVDRLTAVYTISGFRVVALTIPASLIKPIVRAYPYAFNYGRCTFDDGPANLLYLEAKERTAYASIDHYDPTGDHMVGIVLDYES